MALPRLEDFLINLQSNNYSKETVFNYARDLYIFQAFLQLKQIEFANLHKFDVVSYKAFLQSGKHTTLEVLIDIPADFKVSKNVRKNEQDRATAPKLGVSTINRMLSALRSYFKFLDQFDYKIPFSHTSISFIKTEKKNEKEIPENILDIVKFIECPKEFEKIQEVAIRNSAIFELLFSTGMRISELVSVNLEQLSIRTVLGNQKIGTNKLYILGKGKKRRFVYLTDRVIRCLEEYIKFRTDSSAALFVPYRGKKTLTKKSRITVDYIQKKIVSYRKLLGMEIDITAHSLRHAFATFTINNGASVAAMQTLLGHESLATTTKYYHDKGKEAESAHQKYHPLS